MRTGRRDRSRPQSKPHARWFKLPRRPREHRFFWEASWRERTTSPAQRAQHKDAPAAEGAAEATAAVDDDDDIGVDRDRAMIAAVAHDALLIGGADPLATRVQMPPSRKHHALRVKPWSTEAPTAPPTKRTATMAIQIFA